MEFYAQIYECTHVNSPMLHKYANVHTHLPCYTWQTNSHPLEEHHLLL